MFKRRSGLIFLFILSFLYSNAQDSISTIYIDSIIVKSNRFVLESIGSQVYPVRSTNQSAGTALALETPINIKQYGPGVLQTASARGTGASHLGVAWNGINIQGMTHGQVDLSLIPTTDDIVYIAGGNSAMAGSGYLGGLVRLDTRFRKKNKISLGGTLGRFHNYRFQGGLNYSQKKWTSHTTASYQKGKNDFPFINTSSVQKPLVKQINNGYQVLQFRQNIQFTLGKKNTLQFHYWLTNANREIPPSMTAANDHALQSDQAHRFLADWIYSLNAKSSLRTKIAHINEQLTFQNDALHDFTATSKQIIDSRLSLKLKHHQLQLGLYEAFEQADADGYGSKHQRHISALSVADNYLLYKDIKLSGQGRLEIKNFEIITPIFTLAGEWLTNPTAALPLQLKGKIGRHFHRPTFNDLFWKGLGVPDLKDEVGYQGEMSFSFENSPYAKSHWHFNATSFLLNIDNWILWAPNSQGIWRPSNKLKVQSKGIESSIKYALLRKPFTFKSNLYYTFVKTINLADGFEQGKQLLYVPRHKLNGMINLGYQSWSFLSEQYFVSKRPVTTDNSKYVASFFVQNLQLGYTFKNKWTKGLVRFKVNNLWNRPYQIIQFRPMPGLGFEIGIHFDFF